MTEKLLLFGGTIQLAGKVTARGERGGALDVTPASWPIGMGRDFLGTYDLFADGLLLFERGVHDRGRAGPLQWPRRSEIGADVKMSCSSDRPSSGDLVGAISNIVF